MAQTLEKFEQEIEAVLPPGSEGAVQDFKGLVRARFNALAVDAEDIIKLGDGHMNGVAIELRDQISPVGRP